MSDGASTDAAQEFVIRAPGPEHSVTKYFMGMFPGGDPGFAKKKHADWQLEQEPESDTSRSMLEASRVRPWRLLESGGSMSHRGLPEGGLAGASSSAGYFVLIKEGDKFTAIPIDDFYSFRPTQKFKVNSLEEAERQMDSRTRIAFPAATSRLAALVAQADERGGAEAEGVSSGSEREEEDEDDFMSGGRQGGANGAAGQAKGEADEGTDVAVDKQKKGEDWEHEDERADDDVDMGEEGEDADATSTPPKGVRVGSDSDDDGRSTPGLNIQSKLKNTGLESDSDDDDDDVDDDLDDDDMDGPDAFPKVKMSASADQQGGRRRTPTPTPMPAPSSSQQAQPMADNRPAKRKAEDAAMDGTKKAKHSETAAVPPVGDGGGGVTEQEIVDFLKASGPIASSALTARFKRQIKTPENKTGFTKLVKKVAKLEEVPPGSGNRCIVLKH